MTRPWTARAPLCRLAMALAMAGTAAPAAAAPESATAARAPVTTAEGIAFVEGVFASAAEALGREGLTPTQQGDIVRRILLENLAIKRLTPFMIRTHRRAFDDRQYALYERIFPEYITALYAEKFERILGRGLTADRATPIGADVFVTTEVQRASGEPVGVTWRIGRFDGVLKILDIRVEGVSFILVKRDEFSSFIAERSVDAFLGRLDSERLRLTRLSPLLGER